MKNQAPNVVEKPFPDPFLKTQNLTYLWINSLKFYTICFYCMQSCGLSKYIETPLAFMSYEVFFKKTKRGLKLVSLPHFLHDF